MRYCSQCGQQVNNADKFCSSCGTATEAERTAQSNGDQKSASAASQTSAGNESTALLTELRYQGVFIRAVAHCIDTIPVFILFFFIGVFVAAQLGVGQTESGFELEGVPALIVILLTMAAAILYFTLLEAFWGGQTLGKKLTRIKVTNREGGPISFGQALNRNLWRLLDGVFFYLFGAILVWRSPLNQRLGDRMADTIVIKKINTAKAAKVDQTAKAKKTSRLKFGSRDVDMMDFD